MPTLNGKNRNIDEYIVGYVDGEGCFSISFSVRPKLLIGWETKPSFSVSQNHYRSEVLYLIQGRLGCGNMRRDFSDQTLKYEVRKLEDLVTKVIPFFDRCPLLSGKQKDFLLFRQICPMIQNGDHLNAKGFTKILELAVQMNESGRRRYKQETILATIQKKI
jgi:hypothetical protein